MPIKCKTIGYCIVEKNAKGEITWGDSEYDAYFGKHAWKTLSPGEYYAIATDWSYGIKRKQYYAESQAVS